jgi:hypothetical protein
MNKRRPRSSSPGHSSSALHAKPRLFLPGQIIPLKRITAVEAVLASAHALLGSPGGAGPREELQLDLEDTWEDLQLKLPRHAKPEGTAAKAARGVSKLITEAMQEHAIEEGITRIIDGRRPYDDPLYVGCPSCEGWHPWSPIGWVCDCCGRLRRR